MSAPDANPSSSIPAPAFRLVRTLDLRFASKNPFRAIRAELFQDPVHPTHFRYWVWGLQDFPMTVPYQDQPLTHQLLTTICLPNRGAGDFFEAADIEAAEARFYADFASQITPDI
jgi:hypothetical protein